ncbi:MAG: hypothetical protein H6765_08535 [Candidatus Peribacteria bacterium]|nr:MAG: hypothetical protein H6765_08535 [Candidatus Peribacteria bacterium]
MLPPTFAHQQLIEASFKLIALQPQSTETQDQLLRFARLQAKEHDYLRILTADGLQAIDRSVSFSRELQLLHTTPYGLFLLGLLFILL